MLVRSSFGGHAWDDRRPLTRDENSAPNLPFRRHCRCQGCSVPHGDSHFEDGVASFVFWQRESRVHSNSHSKSTKVPTHLISFVRHTRYIPKRTAYTHFLVHGTSSLRFSLSPFPSNLDYFFLRWIQLYRIMGKGRKKDFLARTKEKGVDVDTGIVTGKLSKKRLGLRTKKEYQNMLDRWDR